MIPVAAHDVGGVNFGPVVEIKVIIGQPLSVQAGFSDRPAIKHLVHHEKSHAVAQIKKFRGGRIVRGADGVDAERFQHFQT